MAFLRLFTVHCVAQITWDQTLLCVCVCVVCCVCVCVKIQKYFDSNTLFVVLALFSSTPDLNLSSEYEVGGREAWEFVGVRVGRSIFAYAAYLLRD